MGFIFAFFLVSPNLLATSAAGFYVIIKKYYDVLFFQVVSYEKACRKKDK
jgi:hypothetical protein